MNILVYGLSENWGGVEAIVLAIVKELEKKCSFDLLLSDGKCNYTNKLDKYANINILRITPWGRNPFKFASELKHIYTCKSYDYVWINTSIMSNVQILTITKKVSDAKIISHSHGSSFEANGNLKSILLLALHYLNRSKYLEKVDYKCTCSQKAAEWFYGIKFCKNNQIYVVKNGIDLENYKFNPQIRKEYRKKMGVEEKLVLFHAGRLVLVKNQKRIIDVLFELHKKKIDVQLLLAGEGALLSELMEYADSLGVANNICFLGNREDIYELMQVADYFLLPSLHEGFPVTLVEAQASGLKCLVSTGVSSEVNLTGLVTFMSLSESTSEDWAKYLLEVSQEVQDRTRLSLEMKKYGYDIKDVAESFFQFIQL